MVIALAIQVFFHIHPWVKNPYLGIIFIILGAICGTSKIRIFLGGGGLGGGACGSVLASFLNTSQSKGAPEATPPKK